MAVFIKCKEFEGFNTDGEPMKGYRQYSDDELLDLVRTDKSKFFEVPESHAEQVLRRSPHYQEIRDDVLEAYSFTRVVVEEPTVAEERTTRPSSAGVPSPEVTVSISDTEGVVGHGDVGVEEVTVAGAGEEAEGIVRADESVSAEGSAGEASLGGEASAGNARATTSKPRRRASGRGNRKGQGK